MTNKKDLTIELSDQAKKQMAADPKMAEGLRDLFAIMRQAHAGVKSGQYKTFDDAMEALTGSRPKKIDPETGEEIEGATMHHDLRMDAEDVEEIDIESASIKKEDE